MKGRTILIILVLITACCIGCLILALVVPSLSGVITATQANSSAQDLSTSILKITPSPSPEWMAPPYKSICKKDDSMTSVQLEAYLDSFIGKKIENWHGWVYEVRESGTSYTVLIGMDPPGGLLWSRNVEIVGVEQEQALRLRKEQKVTFSGTIREVGNFFGSICNPITIENATIVEE
jgi:hypothetical protein